MGNNVEALKNLTSLAGNPILATETHRLKAMAEVQVNNLAAADQDINVTLRDEPDDPAALLERGIIRQRMNDMKGARSDWEQVVDLAPDSHEADLARQDLDLLASDPDAMTGAGSDGVAQTVSTSH
jgi:regulator of sirC expression with transglutaminase-like and TPR domain